MKRITIFGLLFSFGLLAATVGSPVSSGSSSATTSSCKLGTPAVIAGHFACLIVRQPCQKRFQASYVKFGFRCLSRRLAKLPPKRPTTSTTSTTTSQVSTTTATVPGQTRAVPVPLGQQTTLSDSWTFSITSVDFNAGSAIVASNPHNTLPPTGRVDVLVGITAKYTGVGTSRFDTNGTLFAIGAENEIYSNSENTCGSLPATNLALQDPLTSPGGTISGFAVCFQIAANEASSLVLFANPEKESTDGATWMALR
jgi:hypothetical protein